MPVTADFETVEVSTDLLILGGGFSACGAATEAAYWAKKNGLKVTVVDKAAMDRSGAVAMGLSAINQYVGIGDGDNTAEEYVQYVRQDLMGVSREDLVYNIARHVDGTVHLFEKWGLNIWKDEDGNALDIPYVEYYWASDDMESLELIGVIPLDSSEDGTSLMYPVGVYLLTSNPSGAVQTWAQVYLYKWKCEWSWG